MREANVLMVRRDIKSITKDLSWTQWFKCKENIYYTLAQNLSFTETCDIIDLKQSMIWLLLVVCQMYIISFIF